MFKKRIKVSIILFSVFLMMILSGVVVRNEIEISRDKQREAERLAGSINTGTQIPYHWPSICALKRNSFFSIKKIIEKVTRRADFRSHEVMYFPKNKEYGIWNYWDSLGRAPQEEFRIATTEEAFKYYKNNMLMLVNILSGFDLWYFLLRFIIVFAISGIPSLLAFLSSVFAVSFPITAPITVIVLLFFTMVQGYAEDITVIKLTTETTGDTHDLALGMFHLRSRTGGLIFLSKGIQGAFGPVWKFSEGIVFFPVGIVCGKGENGVRVEYLSLWSISSVNIGKFNHLLMGSYNHPVIKSRSSFVFAKETLYWAVSELQPGIRADYFFQKTKEWKKKISIGPTLKFVKKNFTFHIHASLTRPHTIKTEWELAF